MPARSASGSPGQAATTASVKGVKELVIEGKTPEITLEQAC